jgi:hypothetical protein
LVEVRVRLPSKSWSEALVAPLGLSRNVEAAAPPSRTLIEKDRIAPVTRGREVTGKAAIREDVFGGPQMSEYISKPRLTYTSTAYLKE